MIKKIFYTIAISLAVLLPTSASAQQVIKPSQGGTGISTGTSGDIGNCLKVTASPLTWGIGACGSGGGGASPDWNKQLNYNVFTLTPTTTLPVWLKDQLFASSSATFAGLVTASSFTATTTTATSTYAGQSFHGTLYTANPDRVIVAPYGIATTSSNNNWGASAGETSKEFITTAHQSRIRQNGTIERIGLNNVNKTGLTAFYVKVWRRNEIGTFDVVGTSENIVSSITVGGLSTTTLASPIINVREGDYLGYRMEWSGGASTNNFSATTTGSQGGTYSVTNASLPSLAYNWVAQTYTNQQYLVLEAYMQAPVFVSISDSIFTGHGGTTINAVNYPDHYSFIETTDLTFLRGAPGTLLANRTGWTYQNMGIGGIGSDDTVARFTQDVINLKPKFVIIEIGSNDLSSKSAAQIAANWQTMIDSATANNIKVVGLLIPPRLAISSANMIVRDAANALIAQKVLAAGGIVVNVDTYVGKFRAGGTAGNLWDQRDEYRESFAGLSHFNMFGYDRFVDAIIDALNGRVTVKGTVDASGLTVGGSITFAPNTPHDIEIPRANTLNLSGFPLDLAIRAGGVMASSTDSGGGNVKLYGGLGTGQGTSTEFQLYGSQASSTSGVVDNAFYKILSVSPSGLTVNNNISILGTTTSMEMAQCYSSVPSYNNDCSVWRAKTTGSQNVVETTIGPKYSGDLEPTAGIFINSSGLTAIGTTTANQQLTLVNRDTTTNAMTFPLSVGHALTSGTMANGAGSGILFKQMRSSSGSMIGQGYLGMVWSSVGSETSDLVLAPIRSGGGNGTEMARLLGANGFFGIGTTTPGTALGVVGDGFFTNSVMAKNFVATSTISTNIFPYASSTVITVSGLSYLNGGVLSLASSTLNVFTFLNATGTNATTTSFFSTTASSTNTFVGGILLVGTSTTVAGTPFVVSQSGTIIARIESISTSGARDAILQLYVPTSGANDPHGQIQFIGKMATGAQITEATIVGNGGVSGNGSTGNLIFNTTKAGTVSESARFNNVGFGIGTTTPSARLSVEGESLLGNRAQAGYFVATTTNAVSSFGGYVGIGTTTPAAKLDISGVGTALGAISLLVDKANSNPCRYSNTSAQGSIMFCGNTGGGSTNLLDLRMDENQAGRKIITARNSASTEVFTVDSTGSIGIGSSTPSGRLTVQGSGTGTGLLAAFANSSGVDKVIFTDNGNTFMYGLTASAGTPSSVCMNATTFEVTVNPALTCTVSDEDQKTPLVPLDFSALDMVAKMSPSSFEYKDNLGRTRYGFGAQSLQKIDPHLGDAYDKKGIARSIDLPALIAVNTKAIQELNNKIIVGNSSTNQTQENWQWLIIALLVVGGIYQQVQINKLKK